MAAMNFGGLTIEVSDSDFLVEPAAAVVLSANSHLNAHTGGAGDAKRTGGKGYEDACVALAAEHPDGLPQGSAWLTGDGFFDFGYGPRVAIQAITIRYRNGQLIRATPEIVYYAARRAFEVADRRGIESVATHLWAVRDSYATARPAAIAEGLLRAAVDHGTVAHNLGRIVVCEPTANQKRHALAVECLQQAHDLWQAHPHSWMGCRLEKPTMYAANAVDDGWAEPHKAEEDRLARASVVPNALSDLLSQEIGRLGRLQQQIHELGAQDATGKIDDAISALNRHREAISELQSAITQQMIRLCGVC